MGYCFQAHAAIFLICSNRRCRERGSIEDYAIVDLYIHYLGENCFQMSFSRFTMGKEIGVSRDPIFIFRPKRDQHSSLEDKVVSVIRDRQAVDKSFESVGHQNHIENLPFSSRKVEQALPNGSRQVFGCFFSHCGLSLPGRAASDSKPRSVLPRQLSRQVWPGD